MTRKSGSLVLDRLRDRILLGRYFGRWTHGDRLPSVRDVAVMEGVDRKTAAAAYRKLEREGLVRVEPRSGVYLGGDGAEAPGDPLRRLHARWLEHAMTAAAELGLPSRSVARMLEYVVQVESLAIPLVDDDPEHAAFLARELRARTGLRLVGRVAGDTVVPTEGDAPPPFVVATPVAAARLRNGRKAVRAIQATLAPELVARVAMAAATSASVVVVASSGLKRELERALNHGLLDGADSVWVVVDRDLAQATPPAASRWVLWPGTVVPGGVPGGVVVDDLTGASLASAGTVHRIRREVVRCALSALNTSSAA